jgi:hypothetical protein
MVDMAKGFPFLPISSSCDLLFTQKRIGGALLLWFFVLLVSVFNRTRRSTISRAIRFVSELFMGSWLRDYGRGDIFPCATSVARYGGSSHICYLFFVSS